MKEQREKIQSLDEYVSGIEEQTSKAAEVMTKAVHGRRTLQKRKWILIVIALVMLLVTGMILYVSWRADQKTIVVQAPPPPPPPQPSERVKRDMSQMQGYRTSGRREEHKNQDGKFEVGATRKCE